ncbi:hypothetical protein J6590_098687 [Homalodisca vitripennis]|nr:hypothetical protein J6590_098687 [Homalodisca vitripennis]
MEHEGKAVVTVGCVSVPVSGGGIIRVNLVESVLQGILKFLPRPLLQSTTPLRASISTAVICCRLKYFTEVCSRPNYTAEFAQKEPSRMRVNKPSLDSKIRITKHPYGHDSVMVAGPRPYCQIYLGGTGQYQSKRRRDLLAVDIMVTNLSHSGRVNLSPWSNVDTVVWVVCLCF